jgi:hypothetical protein
VDISGVTINKPEIRDHDGSLIHPSDYFDKFSNSQVVAVEVVLKMYVTC